MTRKLFFFAVMLAALGGTAFAQASNQAVYTSESSGSLFYDMTYLSTPPPATYDTGWDLILDPSSIMSVSADDSFRFETHRTVDNDQYDFQMFKFVVTQDTAAMTSIVPKWTGYGEDSSGYYCYFYIWNLNLSSWEVVAPPEAIGTPDGTITTTISSNFSDYVDSDGSLFLVAGAKHDNYMPGVPTPLYPTLGYIYSNGTSSVTLEWETVTDDDSGDFIYYQVQYGLTNPPTVSSSWAAATTFLFEELEGGNVYYWRVRASDDAGSTYTDWSSMMNFTVQSGALGLEEGGFMKALACVESTAGVFWEAFTAPKAKAAFPRSLNTNLCEITVSYGGAAEDPSAPELVYPLNTESGVALQPIFRWNPSVGTIAMTYRLQVATTNDFSGGIELDKIALGTSYYAVTMGEALDYSTRYYWRVCGTNSESTGLWSEVRYFDTGSLPGAPTAKTPQNGIIDESTVPKITWYAPTTGTQPFTYTLQVDSTNIFTVPLEFPGIEDVEYNVSLENELTYGATYYWRVKATNGFGDSSWSAIYSFSTFQSPTVPALSSPGEGAFDQLLQPTFEWELSSGTAPITYILEIDTILSFPDPVSFSGISGTSFSLQSANALVEDTIYFWRLRAKNNLGESGWAPYRTLKTGVSSTAPELYSPADASTGLSSVMLTWTAPDAGSEPYTYIMQMDISGTFPFPMQIETSDLTFTPENLQYATTYYWRVKAVNDFGESAWTDARTFSLAVPVDPDVQTYAPTTPVLELPVNGKKAVDTTAVTLSWTASTGTEPITYMLMLDDNSDFATPIVDAEDISDISYSITNLSAYKTYYWKVKAVNAYGETEWSTAWNFYTYTPATDDGTDDGTDGTDNSIPLDTGSKGSACFLGSLVK